MQPPLSYVDEALPLHAGNYDVEDAWNSDTDRFDQRKVKVECPSCERVFAALCSPHTVKTDGGWRWVGCDHREPYTSWRTRCSCGAEFTFDTYIPQ